MKKDKLLEEYKNMELSNPIEVTGGEQEWVSYDTQYSTASATNSTPTSPEYVDDVKTDWAWVHEQDNTRTKNYNSPFIP